MAFVGLRSSGKAATPGERVTARGQCIGRAQIAQFTHQRGHVWIGGDFFVTLYHRLEKTGIHQRIPHHWRCLLYTSPPVLRSRAVDALAGAELHFKPEHLQLSGAFKFRGACNAVFALDAAAAARGVVTHSSGNHGAALALAAQLRGIACHVVVPEGAVPAKLAAITHYGACLLYTS